MKQLMAEEEIVIIYGVKEKNSKTGSTIGHYFVGMKKEESCIFLMDKRVNMLFLPKQESMVTLFKEVILVWGQIIKLNLKTEFKIIKMEDKLILEAIHGAVWQKKLVKFTL